MKVVVMIKATRSSEAGEFPSQQLLTDMGNYNAELVNAGILLDGVGLKPSSSGVRLRFSGRDRVVTDGPFTETKELIAGFWIWRVKSMAEAVAWAKRCPNPMPEESEIEIRPVLEAEDFGAEFTPELREQEATVLAASLGLKSLAFEAGGDLLLAGLNRTYTLETRVAIPQQWEEFVRQADRVPHREGATYYGVCCNTTPDCGFEYLTGLEVAPEVPVPAGFTTLPIPGRRYAVFPHTEHVSAIPATLETIWRKWVPDCGLKIANAPCFERYTAEYNPGTGLGGMEIWIPLES